MTATTGSRPIDLDEIEARRQRAWLDGDQQATRELIANDVPDMLAHLRAAQPAGNAFTAALRELADYLDAHPDLPVPDYESGAEVHISVLDGGDDERRAEVDRIAAVLGVPAHTTPAGAYLVRRTFGGRVRYSAAMVPAEYMARYNAEMTYAGAVTP
jgi:hypothetical protein